MVAKIFKIFTVLVVIGYADSALTTSDEMTFHDRRLQAGPSVAPVAPIVVALSPASPADMSAPVGSPVDTMPPLAVPTAPVATVTNTGAPVSSPVDTFAPVVTTTVTPAPVVVGTPPPSSPPVAPVASMAPVVQNVFTPSYYPSDGPSPSPLVNSPFFISNDVPSRSPVRNSPAFNSEDRPSTAPVGPSRAPVALSLAPLAGTSPAPTVPSSGDQTSSTPSDVSIPDAPAGVPSSEQSEVPSSVIFEGPVFFLPSAAPTVLEMLSGRAAPIGKPAKKKLDKVSISKTLQKMLPKLQHGAVIAAGETAKVEKRIADTPTVAPYKGTDKGKKETKSKKKGKSKKGKSKKGKSKKGKPNRNPKGYSPVPSPTAASPVAYPTVASPVPSPTAASPAASPSSGTGTSVPVKKFTPAAADIPVSFASVKKFPVFKPTLPPIMINISQAFATKGISNASPVISPASSPAASPVSSPTRRPVHVPL